jgi:VWFA-related protein
MGCGVSPIKGAVIAACAILAVVLSSQQAPGGQSESSDPSLLTLRQEVRNVILDVVAVDKHGEPVTGLDQSRFHVYENGAEQEISFFEEHRAAEKGAASTPAAAQQQAETALPPGEHTNVESAPPSGALTALLLDGLNTRLTDQPFVRNEILSYLKRIPPGTHMAVFTLGDKLQMIQGFTSDPAVLKAALDGRAYPISSALSPQSLASAGNVMSTRSSLNHFANEENSFSQELRIRYTLDALNALSVYLAGIPGRKNLIWFSGSIPLIINPDFSLVTSPVGRVDYSEEVKRLADAMTIGRITIYPVDARGLMASPVYSADYLPGMNSASMAKNNGGTGRMSGSALGGNEFRSQMNLGSSHMSMSNLAAATGGRAFYNTNGLADAVGKVQAIGDSYYTIAYSPKDKRYDGGYRELKVTIGDPEIKLEYRPGYFAEDPAKATGRSLLVNANALRGVMQRGAPGSTQIPFRVQVTLASRQPDAARSSDRLGNRAAALKAPFVRYDIHWVVDVHSLEITPEADGEERGEVDAAIAAYDADGNVLNDLYSVLPLKLSAAQYSQLLKSGLPMKQTLDLPAGMVYLRTGVVDPSDNHTGATEFPFMAGAEQAAAAAHH